MSRRQAAQGVPNPPDDVRIVVFVANGPVNNVDSSRVRARAVPIRKRNGPPSAGFSPRTNTMRDVITGSEVLRRYGIAFPVGEIAHQTDTRGLSRLSFKSDDAAPVWLDLAGAKRVAAQLHRAGELSLASRIDRALNTVLARDVRAAGSRRD